MIIDWKVKKTLVPTLPKPPLAAAVMGAISK
jgi:hypothetical protein